MKCTKYVKFSLMFIKKQPTRLFFYLQDISQILFINDDLFVNGTGTGFHLEDIVAFCYIGNRDSNLVIVHR